MMTKRNVDLRILGRILRAFETGRYPALEKFESEFRSAYDRLKVGENSEDNDEDDLDRILANNAEALAETIVATARDTLEFVESELKRFRAIKEQRPLTDDEKRIGKEVLRPLMSSLSRLLKGA